MTTGKDTDAAPPTGGPSGAELAAAFRRAAMAALDRINARLKLCGPEYPVGEDVDFLAQAAILMANEAIGVERVESPVTAAQAPMKKYVN